MLSARACIFSQGIGTGFIRTQPTGQLPGSVRHVPPYQMSGGVRRLTVASTLPELTLLSHD